MTAPTTAPPPLAGAAVVGRGRGDEPARVDRRRDRRPPPRGDRLPHLPARLGWPHARGRPGHRAEPRRPRFHDGRPAGHGPRPDPDPDRSGVVRPPRGPGPRPGPDRGHEGRPGQRDQDHRRDRAGHGRGPRPQEQERHRGAPGDLGRRADRGRPLGGVRSAGPRRARRPPEPARRLGRRRRDAGRLRGLEGPRAHAVPDTDADSDADARRRLRPRRRHRRRRRLRRRRRHRHRPPSEPPASAAPAP